jgi:cardiolipin synthase A/B
VTVTFAQAGLAVHLLLALAVSGHIVLTKTDVRAATAWTGLVWLAPVIGSVLYLFLGINRIRRRAGRLRLTGGAASSAQRARVSPEAMESSLDRAPAGLRALAALVGEITGAPLTHGNTVEPLINGDAAYPAMVAAIDSAQRSVALVTYIFDRGVVADMFLAALERAVTRGVTVRVLIDGVGSRYSHPPIIHALRVRGITVAKFLPSMIPILHPFFNLRNHRKLLVVDGAVGFCGGLNIRDACMLSLNKPHPTQDIHFRLRGPVVRQFMSAVAFDWKFTTGETLAGDCWFTPDAAVPPGDICARGIPDGPDEDFETLLLALLGALGTATKSVRVVTPYFLPDAPLLDAIKVAALRGVCVDIVLPERGNLRLVQWAQTAQLAQVLNKGVRVFLAPPPFDHSKLLVVDGEWCLVGSANWDPRSLRLNFEYVVECYSTEVAATLERIIDEKTSTAREVTRAELDQRRLVVKLRDGVVWLAQPYL